MPSIFRNIKTGELCKIERVYSLAPVMGKDTHKYRVNYHNKNLIPEGLNTLEDFVKVTEY